MCLLQAPHRLRDLVFDGLKTLSSPLKLVAGFAKQTLELGNTIRFALPR